MLSSQELRVPPGRYIGLAFLCFLGTIVFISSSSPAGVAVISNRLSRHGDSSPSGWLDDVTPGTPSEAESEPAVGIDNVSSRPAAAFVILAREKDLIPILESIRQMEGMEKDKPRPCTGVLAHTSARGTLPFSRSLQSQAPLRLRAVEP